MSAKSKQLVVQILFGAYAALSFPVRASTAQEAVVATARLSAFPSTRAGVDSGKFFLSLKLKGIPEVALRGISLDQIVLVDQEGRAYTPSLYTIPTTALERKSFLAGYLAQANERLADRQYMFMVAPGSQTFELRVANMKPVSVAASLVGFPR